MSTQQVLMIHGGTTFDTYEEYISFLQNKSLDLERLRPNSDWTDTLADELGNAFDVLKPRMPNGTNAQYEEWKLWFEKILEIVDDEIVLVGHSLGGIFLIKYLSENTVPRSVKALFLVAPPFTEVGLNESLGSFQLGGSLQRVPEQVARIYTYHSTDDEVVPYAQTEQYQDHFPDAILRSFHDRGHFKIATFPEFVADVKGLM